MIKIKRLRPEPPRLSVGRLADFPNPDGNEPAVAVAYCFRTHRGELVRTDQGERVSGPRDAIFRHQTIGGSQSEKTVVAERDATDPFIDAAVATGPGDTVR